MVTTRLSRASFYVYFKDRYDLVQRLFERACNEIWPAINQWALPSRQPLSDLRSAMEAVAKVCRRHGYLFKALADAAGLDPRIEKFYRGLLDRAVRLVTQRIRNEIKRRTIKPVNHPEELARALCLAGERYFIETMGRSPQIDAAIVADTMVRVWGGALYGK
jgi:AcrR family transcriptional regulator